MPALTHIVPDGRALPGVTVAPLRSREGFRALPDSRATTVRCELIIDGSSEPIAAHAG